MNNTSERNENNTEKNQNKKFFTPVFFITSLICLLPIVLGFILYDKLPEDIPQQYGWNNQVNWTLPKPWGFIMCPLILLAVNIVMHWSVKASKQNLSRKVESILQWLISLISLPVNAMIILLPAGIKAEPINIIAPVLAIMFIILGNYLPKIENNGLIGVRFSWTRSNTEVWAKTQRFSGKIMVVMGFIILVTSFTSFSKYVLAGGTILFVLVTLVYSLIIAEKVKKQGDSKEVPEE